MPTSGQNWQFFVPCDLEIWWITLENNRTPLLHYVKLCASFQSISEFTRVSCYSPETLNTGQNQQLFVPCDLEIWWMTVKNNRASLLDTASSFVHNFIAISEFKLELQSGKANFRSKSMSRVTMKFNRWPWKTICYFKLCALWLQSGNAQFGSKSMIFLAVWPGNLTDDLEKQ